MDEENYEGPQKAFDNSDKESETSLTESDKLKLERILATIKGATNDQDKADEM